MNDDVSTQLSSHCLTPKNYTFQISNLRWHTHTYIYSLNAYVFPHNTVTSSSLNFSSDTYQPRRLGGSKRPQEQIIWAEKMRSGQMIQWSCFYSQISKAASRVQKYDMITQWTLVLMRTADVKKIQERGMQIKSHLACRPPPHCAHVIDALLSASTQSCLHRELQ